MKAFLVVLLFALTTCVFPDNLVKLAKCVLSSQTVFEVLPKAVEAVKSGDYFTLLQIALTELPKVKEEVMECMDQPVLKVQCDITEFEKCKQKCESKRKQDAWAEAACLNDCRRKCCSKPPF